MSDVLRYNIDVQIPMSTNNTSDANVRGEPNKKSNLTAL